MFGPCKAISHSTTRNSSFTSLRLHLLALQQCFWSFILYLPHFFDQHNQQVACMSSLFRTRTITLAYSTLGPALPTDIHCNLVLPLYHPIPCCPWLKQTVAEHTKAYQTITTVRPSYCTMGGSKQIVPFVTPTQRNEQTT